METVYLLGIAYLYANDASQAAIEFATVYQRSPELLPRAREQLAAIIERPRPPRRQALTLSLPACRAGRTSRCDPPLLRTGPSTKKLPGYAGSETCGRCHVDVYRQWSQSGMAKMLRPYQPQNVIGDFEETTSSMPATISPIRTGNFKSLVVTNALYLHAWSFRVAVTTSTLRNPTAAGTPTQWTTPSAPNGSRRTLPNWPTGRFMSSPFNTARLKKNG